MIHKFKSRHSSVTKSDVFSISLLQLGGVQNMVSTVEKALRLVSDHIAEEDNPAGMETDDKKPVIKTEPGAAANAASTTSPAEDGDKTEGLVMFGWLHN